MFVGKPSKSTATDDVDWIPTLLLPTYNILQPCTSQNGMREIMNNDMQFQSIEQYSVIMFHRQYFN